MFFVTQVTSHQITLTAWKSISCAALSDQHLGCFFFSLSVLCHSVKPIFNDTKIQVRECKIRLEALTINYSHLVIRMLEHLVMHLLHGKIPRERFPGAREGWGPILPLSSFDAALTLTHNQAASLPPSWMFLCSSSSSAHASLLPLAGKFPAPVGKRKCTQDWRRGEMLMLGGMEISKGFQNPSQRWGLYDSVASSKIPGFGTSITCPEWLRETRFIPYSEFYLHNLAFQFFISHPHIDTHGSVHSALSSLRSLSSLLFLPVFTA